MYDEMTLVTTGQNFEVYEDKDGDLHIKVNMGGPRTPSGSGKSDVIATSRGNTRLPITKAGEPAVMLGLNLFQYKTAK